ncbi:MAG: hypothetical protein LKF75_04895 [Bacilli bacterium]|jgi:uncharacterized membrane protein YhdT|nr:hypothetical protein [Bacilli bacterium]MCH4211160.1 hypothetical protein [Bacilli bacterium]MCH4229011.1 hypothetical protein [Bacilli bacterium]MCH4277486.1 hypothetical protein [Bacilli bacterium]
MAQWYMKLNVQKKALFLMAMVALGGFLIMIPLFFLTTDSGYPLGSLPLGWLLGSVIELLAYSTIIMMSNAITASQNKTTGMAAGLALGSHFVRFILYLAGLLISAICTFKSEWFGGFNAFSFYTCAAAYLPMLFIVLFTQFRETRQLPIETIKNEDETK